MSAKALSLSKQIVSEIKLANTTFTMNGKKLDKSFLQVGPMSEFLSTSKVFGKSAKELEHLASSYATYLRSTRSSQNCKTVMLDVKRPLLKVLVSRIGAPEKE
uniref:Uncharacterized protein n=1 Tax=Ditylenchus dipsaci TaxID=166011 RepID=A0A915DMR9_9BILA